MKVTSLTVTRPAEGAEGAPRSLVHQGCWRPEQTRPVRHRTTATPRTVAHHREPGPAL